MASTRKRVAWGAAIAFVLVLAGAGLIVVRHRATDQRSDVCAALGAPVGSLREFGWDNGVTSSSASWGQVLSDGVQHGRLADRAAMAQAVAQDIDGYARLFGSAPVALMPALNRQRALALDAEDGYAHRRDPHVVADAREISRFGTVECGFA